EDEIAELDLSNDVLEGLAIAATDRQIAQAFHFLFVEQPFELQVKVEALQPQARGEEVFGFHARLLQALAGEEFRGLLQRLEEVNSSTAA
ncbi:MAG: hypothetical protein NTV94_18395, partial [Planctomycetota bacterium]|nr:hypothetical protein [Planctomycetota bacterium]